MLIVIGIAMIAYTGFSYATTEKVVDLGPLEISRKKNNTVSWPPIAGVVLLVGGAAVLFWGKRT